MKISKGDIIWNYLGIFINLAINIILLPLVLKFLTDDEVGLWYVYTSIGTIVTLLDFGFAPALARNIAYSYSGAKSLKKENVDIANSCGPNFILMKKVLKTCKLIYLGISLIALLFLLTVGTFYINGVGSNINQNILYISWIIYVFAVFFNIYIGYFSSFLKGISAIKELNKATVLSKLLQIIISIILLLLGYGLIAVTIAYLISGLINRELCKMYFFKYDNIGSNLSKVKYDVKYIEVKKTFMLIWHNAWKDGLVTISNYLVTQAGTIMCSLFLTLSQTGIYSIALQLVTILSSVASSMYTVSQPSIQEAFAKNDKSKMAKLMSLSIIVYIIIFLLGTIVLCTLGVFVIGYIKKDTTLDPLFTFVMCIYMFLYQNHCLFASFISNENRIPYTKSFIISGIAVVLVETLLFTITDLQQWVLLIVPIFIQLTYNNWKWPRQVLDDLDLSIFSFIKIGIKEIKFYFQSYIIKKGISYDKK